MDSEHNKQKRFWRACVLGPLLALLLSGCGMFRPADNGPAPVKAQKGFDCSGLIWWAYRQNGMSVPRVTVDQARAGQSVPKSLARPGDIVVFRTGQSPRGLHTGIYAGDDSFIHSPRRGERVRMESMNIPYWRSKLISVRRVVR